MNTKQYWLVVGYDSTTQIYERLVPVRYITQKKMIETLRYLAASSGLSFDEILDCHTKKNTKSHRELLEVYIDINPIFTITCGLNPYFIASVVEK